MIIILGTLDISLISKEFTKHKTFELATYANGQKEAPQKQMLFLEQMACLALAVENNFELCKEQ